MFFASINLAPKEGSATSTIGANEVFFGGGTSPPFLQGVSTNQLMWGQSSADGTDKSCRLTTIHRDNDTEEAVCALYCYNGVGFNSVNLGGGPGNNNAATRVSQFAAATATTLTGTEVTQAAFGASGATELILMQTTGRLRTGGTTGPTVSSGSGDPNGVVSAPLGSLYLNTAGGAGVALYAKEGGGTGNTGWVGK